MDIDQTTIYEALIGIIKNGPICDDRNEDAVSECIERGWAETVGEPYLCEDGMTRVGVEVTVAGRAVADLVEGVVDDVEWKANARRELEVSSACLQVLRGLKADVDPLKDVERVTPKHVINEIRKARLRRPSENEVFRKVLLALELYRTEEHDGVNLDVTRVVGAVGCRMADVAVKTRHKVCSQILKALNLYDREKHGRVEVLTPANVIAAVAENRVELKRRVDDDLTNREGVESTIRAQATDAACRRILAALGIFDRDKWTGVDLLPQSVVDEVSFAAATGLVGSPSSKEEIHKEISRRIEFAVSEACAHVLSGAKLLDYADEEKMRLEPSDVVEAIAARAKRRELEIVDEISMSVFGAEVSRTVEGLVEVLNGRESTLRTEAYKAEQLAAEANKRTAQAEQHTDKLIDATAALMEQMRRMAAEAMEVTFAQAMGREMKHMVDFNNPAEKARQRARREAKS